MIGLGISLLYLNQIANILISLGEYINCKSSNFFIGYIIISSIFCLGYFYFIYIRFIQNRQFSILLTYFSIVYLIFRFLFSNLISFEPINSWIKYADLIIVLFILHIINLLSVDFRFIDLKNRKKTKQEIFFIEDGIYEDGEIDNEKILEKLITTLQNFKPDVAFSIGINAVWGYGKSSFLEKFRKDYKQVEPRTIIFWNRIWKNKGSVAIIENFFEELKDNLKPFSAEIAGDINKYVDSILSLSNSDLHNFISAGQSALTENATLEKFYKSINDDIKKIDRQIIILLDDLDRLEKQEIMDTLKLMRTLSDFNNVIFIAGYDRKYIVDTIEKSGKNYLDKIFNVEINLLPFDEQLIIDELIRQVDESFPKNPSITDQIDFNSAFKGLFNPNISTVNVVPTLESISNDNFTCMKQDLRYQDFLKTYRDVKRFFNEFKFNAGFLDSEFDVIGKEYILLKLLTYRFRDLNNILFADINKFLSRGILDEANNKLQFNTAFDENSNTYVYDEESKKKIDLILQNLNYSDDEKELINAVLCDLFGKKSADFYKTNQNSISKIYYTDVYIRNNIAGGKISLSSLQQAFSSSSLIAIAKDIDASPNSSFQISNELKQFIYNNNPEKEVQFLDFLRTLNIILKHSTQVDDQKVINILREGFHRFFDKNKTLFLEEVFKIIKNEKVGYLDRLLSNINLNFKRQDSKLNYDESTKNFKNNEFNTEDLKKIFFEKLNYLIENKSSSNIIFSIYTLHVEKIVGDKQILHAEEFNKIVRKNVESRFLDYFTSSMFDSVREGIDENVGQFTGYEPNFVLAQIFSNSETLRSLENNPNDVELYEKFYHEGWDNFYAFISSNDFSEIKDEAIKEQLDFMKRFVEGYINNDYKPLNKTQYDIIKENLPF